MSGMLSCKTVYRLQIDILCICFGNMVKGNNTSKCCAQYMCWFQFNN